MHFFVGHPVDCVKVGRIPCLNAFKRGPCVNIDLLLDPPWILGPYIFYPKQKYIDPLVPYWIFVEKSILRTRKMFYNVIFGWSGGNSLLICWFWPDTKKKDLISIKSKTKILGTKRKMMLICWFYWTAALPNLKHYRNFPLILKTSPRYACLTAIQKVKNLR